MPKKPIDKYNRIVVLVSVFLAACVLICCLFLLRQRQKKEELPVLLETLAGDCYFFPGNTAFSEELFTSTAEEIRLVYGHNGAEVFESKDGVRYVAKEEKTIAPSFPVYQKNGATVYLSEEARAYRFFCTDFTLKEMDGEAYVSYGAAFHKDNSRFISEDVFLIDFFDGIYLSTMPLLINDYQEIKIPVNAFLSFSEGEITALVFSDGVLEKQRIPVTSKAMVTIGDTRVSYFSLYTFCKDAYRTTEPELKNTGMILEGDYYYYFLGMRFDIKGPSLLYETEAGLYLENDTKSFLLPECVLYKEGEDTVFLPRNYMLLQTNQHLYTCLPSTTMVKLEEEAVYVSYKETVNSYREVMLHDGAEHYLVTDECSFRLGEIELTISPMSCIYIGDTMEIGFYQYDSEEYFTFSTNGLEPELTLANGDVVMLYERLIYRKDGNLDLLQSDPAVYPTLQ